MNNMNKNMQNAKSALDSLKMEIASELGISNYNAQNKGELTSRQNGYVGGYMTKKLVELGKSQMK